MPPIVTLFFRSREKSHASIIFTSCWCYRHVITHSRQERWRWSSHRHQKPANISYNIITHHQKGDYGSVRRILAMWPRLPAFLSLQPLAWPAHRWVVKGHLQYMTHFLRNSDFDLNRQIIVSNKGFKVMPIYYLLSPPPAAPSAHERPDIAYGTT